MATLALSGLVSGHARRPRAQDIWRQTDRTTSHSVRTIFGDVIAHSSPCRIIICRSLLRRRSSWLVLLFLYALKALIQARQVSKKCLSRHPHRIRIVAVTSAS